MTLDDELFLAFLTFDDPERPWRPGDPLYWQGALVVEGRTYVCDQEGTVQCLSDDEAWSF